MNKLFLGTTALATAILISAPALSAERLHLQLRGYHIGSVSYTDGEFYDNGWYLEDGVAYGSFQTSSIGDYNEINFGSSSEVHFIGSTTLDNGLEITFHAELELEDDPASYDNAEDLIDEVYIQVDGGFGRVQFGQQDGVVDQTHVHEPSTFVGHAVNDVGRGNQDPFDPLGAPNTIKTSGDASGDDIKIIYFTPSMNGLQFGASYTPNPCHNNAGYAGCVFDRFARNYWEVAATFEGNFNNVGIEMSAGYGQGERGTAPARPEELSLGLNLSYGGFTLGGAWSDRNPTGDGDRERTDWAAGITYENGPWGFNLNYGRFDQEDTYLCNSCAAGIPNPLPGYSGGNDSYQFYEQDAESWLAGITYMYGPGMQIGFGVQTLDTGYMQTNTYYDPYPTTTTGFVDIGDRGFEGTSVFLENSLSF